MNRDRRNAIIVGVLLVACTATTILSMTLLNPMLDDSEYLTRLAGNGNLVILGAILEFIWAATAMGIAIWLYPIIKKYNEALALGSVVFRAVEGVLVLIGTLGLLSLLVLSQEFVKAGFADPSSFQTIGITLLAVRHWTLDGTVLMAFCVGALLYYWVLYQSEIIPRWLSGWGILGAALSLAVSLYSLFKPSFVVSWVHTLLNAPIAFQEMVFAVWLIVKGFNPSTVVRESAEKVYRNIEIM